MESGTKSSRSTVKGFLVGLLFGILLTVIVGVSLYLAKKAENDQDHRCSLPGSKPDFLTAGQAAVQPDFLASVHLVTPPWSASLTKVSSQAFWELVFRTEDVVDRIFKASDLSNFYNRAHVTAFRPEETGGVVAELQLYFVGGFSALPSELVDAFQFGFATMQQIAQAYVQAVDSTSFAVSSPTATQTPTTQQPTTPVANRVCGRARLYPRVQSGRIVGGTATDWYGVYPWVAMLTDAGSYRCGGAIWDSQHILTAAHCLDGRSHLDNTIRVNTTDLEVIAGKWLYGADPNWHNSQKVQVAAARLHSGYNHDDYEHDIAVLKLDRPLELNEVVSPICHPDNNMQLPAQGVVAGWGTVREGVMQHPEKLMEVTLHLYNSPDCSRLFKSWFDNGDIDTYLHNGTFCAANGLRGGADSCQGDGGGALFAHAGQTEVYTMFGIVSNGYGCGRVGNPGFYIYVPYYVGWIADTIRDL